MAGGGELQSCSDASQCQTGLQCVGGQCVLEAASAVGDYHAAAGRAALAEGDVEGAIERFSRAVSQYEADELTPPAWLYCEQGRALVAGRDNPERAEIGARVLHRCLLRTPPGSEERRRALDSLARLDALGLEPLALSRTEPADAYLTRTPEQRRPDEVEVEVEGDDTRAQSFRNLISHLEDEDLGDAFTPCWDAYFEETGEVELVLDVPFSYDYQLGPTEGSDRAVVSIPSGEGPSRGPEAEAYDCVVDVLEPIRGEFARTQRQNVGWRGDVTFTFGPAD